MRKAELNGNFRHWADESFSSSYHAPFLFINSPTLDNAGFLGAPTGLFYAVSPLVESIKNGHLDFPPCRLIISMIRVKSSIQILDWSKK